MERLLSLTGAAKRIGVSRWTFRWWVRKGQGPPYKRSPGGRFLFRESDVLLWFSELRGPAVIETPESSGSEAA